MLREAKYEGKKTFFIKMSDSIISYSFCVAI